MQMLKALGSGLAGACALTLLHESARQLVPQAPRVDVLGKRGIAKLLRAAGQKPPDDHTLHALALTGDLASNSLYYSLVGLAGPRYALPAGAVLGAAAGVGAVLLPGPMGLGTKPTTRTAATQAMTIAWYFVGGLVAAAAYQGCAAAAPPRR